MAKHKTSVKATPQSFEDLKVLIADRYPALSPQLQSIARHALDNPNNIALHTVSRIAEQTDSQPSSMVRFAKALGFDGFSDLQQIFRSRLVAGSPSYPERIQSLRQNQTRPGGGESALDTFVEEGIASLEMLRAHTSDENFTRAIELLAGADEIYLAAQKRAFPVAFYMSYALSRLARPCRLLDGVGGMFIEQAALAGPGDLFFAVSFRPYSPQVVAACEQAAEKQLPIIALTDSALSPLARSAAVTFEINDYEERAFRTLVAPMCLAQSLAVQLGIELAERGSERKGK